MMRRNVMLLAGLVFMGSFAPGLDAQGRGRGKSKAQDEPQSQTAVSASVVFSNTEIRIMKDWFGKPSNMKGLPPGLAKKEQLPPGLQRQLVRNGKLPPGLEKKIAPLPHDLEVQLPRCPEGRRRVIISGSVILFDQRSSVILDVVALF